MTIESAKLDAALRMELRSGDEARKITVFIRTADPISEEQAAVLRGLRVEDARQGSQILTATLSVDELGTISGLPWVTAISASRTMRLLR